MLNKYKFPVPVRAIVADESAVVESGNVMALVNVTFLLPETVKLAFVPEKVIVLAIVFAALIPNTRLVLVGVNVRDEEEVVLSTNSFWPLVRYTSPELR